MAKKIVPIEQLLNFQLLEDRIVSNTQDYLFYRYYPPNASIMTDAEIAAEIDKFARTLDTLRCPLSLFITDKIEDLNEIKDYYCSLSPEFEYITSEIVNKLESHEVESTSVQRSYYFVYKPDNNSEDIYNVLVGKGYRVDRVDKAELAVLMRNYLLREFVSTDIYTIEQEVSTTKKNKKVKQAVRNREILKRLSPNRIDFGIFHAEQSGTLRKTIMLKNFPAEIQPTALLNVASIRGTTFTMRLTPMNKSLATKMINQQMNNTSAAKGKKNATDKMNAEQAQEDIKEFYRSISRNQNAIYYTSIFIEMYGKTVAELKEVEAKVMTELGGVSITVEELKYEQQQAFSSVQPLGTDHYIHASNNMPSTTIAALYPSSYSCRLDPKGMYLGRTIEGGNMFVDLFLRDNNITNGNFVITGASGQGKSWLMKKIITFLYIMGCWNYLFDPENEYLDLVRGLGGTVINCADGRVKINPFEVRRLKSVLDIDDETGLPIVDGLSMENNDPAFFQHLSWLADYFQVMFPTMPPEVGKAMMIYVQGMYADCGIDETTDFDLLSPTDYPIFTTLYQFIENHRSEYTSIITDDLTRNCLLYLHDCYKGSLGSLLNGHTNIANNKLICFAMADLLEGSKERTQAVLFNISTYIWNIAMRRENRLMQGLDELYLFLENPMMSKYLQSFAKRARKYDAILGIGTQQLGDCLSGKYANYTTAIFNNASFKFMFHPGAIDLELARKNLHLTDGEVKSISNSHKEHCLLKAGNDKYYMRVGELPYEMNLFGKAGGK